jgi:hypothetical protein
MVLDCKGYVEQTGEDNSKGPHMDQYLTKRNGEVERNKK